MSEQNLKNHAQFVPLFHFVSLPIAFFTWVGAAVNLYEAWGAPTQYSASLIFVVSLLLVLLFLMARSFALKAQDRAIRAEENLRAFVRTGALLDERLTVRQIIGLRFASDAEYDALAARAIAENLSEKEIKAAITSWRPDTYRV